MAFYTPPQIDGAYPERVVLDGFKAAVAAQLSRIFAIDLSLAFSAVDLPKKFDTSDLTVPVPRLKVKGKPNELALKAQAEIQPDFYITSVTANGIFLFFSLNRKSLNRLLLNQITELSKPTTANKYGSYGQNDSGAGKKAVVEFSSPNIAKPFHAGHLRSTIIGTFVSNLLQAQGWEVTRMNYLGDWGKQYGLLALGFERYGSEEALNQNAIMHLFEVYVKINQDLKAEKEAGGEQKTDDLARQIFVKMENGDGKTLALWQHFRDLSIEKYKETYKRLNVFFDVYSGESAVGKDAIDKVMERLKEKNLLTTKTKEESTRDYKAMRGKGKGKEATKTEPAHEEPAGAEPPEPVAPQEGASQSDASLAYAVDLAQYNLGKPVVQKGDGTTIYIVRDLAEAIRRYEKYKFDKMIYVVGDQQDAHVAQFFKILELMGYEWAPTMQHVNFGKIFGMSTRNGEVKFLEEILDMSQEAMLNQMKTAEAKFKEVEDPDYTSDQIGMTCVKVQDMNSKRNIAYEFQLSRMTSFEGDTGAYLQYAHVRLCSLERRVAPDLVLREDPGAINTDLLTEQHAHNIIMLLATYPDVVRFAARSFEPSTIITFCFLLSHTISTAWETLIVKNQETELAQARLLLYQSARQVLASAMRLLSFVPLERM